jgi:hypothetical protein
MMRMFGFLSAAAAGPAINARPMAATASALRNLVLMLPSLLKFGQTPNSGKTNPLDRACW